MKIILAKTLVDVANSGLPLFFLAGPVKGGGDWQRDCCNLLNEKIDQEFYVALPNRYKTDHPMYRHKAEGQEDVFPRQTLWERHYLRQASIHGCLIFWLPCENLSKPRDDGSPYARDTYGEIGEWRERMRCNRSIPLIMGAEKNFPGLSQIQANFNSALNTNFPIHSSLERTVNEAIKEARL